MSNQPQSTDLRHATDARREPIAPAHSDDTRARPAGMDAPRLDTERDSTRRDAPNPSVTQSQSDIKR